MAKFGSFEIEAREPGRLEDGELKPFRLYRIEIEIDLDRLARQLGPRAVHSVNGTSVLGGGKIRARVVGRGRSASLATVDHELCATCGGFWPGNDFEPCCGFPVKDARRVHRAIYDGSTLVDEYEVFPAGLVK